MKVSDIREHFISELKNENFTIDKTGAKTIELIGASFTADEPSIFGTPNQEYIDKEIEWYKSMSNNINDINKDGDPPAAWKYAASEHGEINSNYGLLTMSDKYHDQLGHVADELAHNPDSRRACMIYNRPSIWLEYSNCHGLSDFICTNAVSYMIRDDELISVVQMRSNDVVYGYKNDYAWQQWMQNEVCALVNIDRDTELNTGDIYWQVQNLHVYEKHFNLVN